MPPDYCHFDKENDDNPPKCVGLVALCCCIFSQRICPCSRHPNCVVSPGTCLGTTDRSTIELKWAAVTVPSLIQAHRSAREVTLEKGYPCAPKNWAMSKVESQKYDMSIENPNKCEVTHTLWIFRIKSCCKPLSHFPSGPRAKQLWLGQRHCPGTTGPTFDQ